MEIRPYYMKMSRDLYDWLKDRKGTFGRKIPVSWSIEEILRKEMEKEQFNKFKEDNDGRT